jgi:polyhydroxyalkanoate synthesis regulator protein
LTSSQFYAIFSSMAVVLSKHLEQQLSAFKKAKGKLWQKELSAFLEQQLQNDLEEALAELKAHDQARTISGDLADTLAYEAVKQHRR